MSSKDPKPICLGGGGGGGWLSSESSRNERICFSASVTTLLNMGQRSMNSGELATYSVRESCLLYGSSSTTALLPLRLTLLPDTWSVKELECCIASSKNELLSEPAEEELDPPSLISSSMDAIWVNRWRISPLEDSSLGLVENRVQLEDLAYKKSHNLQGYSGRCLGIVALDPLHSTVAADGSSIVAPSLPQATCLTGCWGTSPSFAPLCVSRLDEVHPSVGCSCHSRKCVMRLRGASGKSRRMERTSKCGPWVMDVLRGQQGLLGD